MGGCSSDMLTGAHYLAALYPIYFHTYVGLGHFLGFKILNFNILGGFQKNNIFWGMKTLWIFFGITTKLDYIKGSFLCILGSFLNVKVQNGGYFLGLLKFQIFSGVFEIPYNFWG